MFVLSLSLSLSLPLARRHTRGDAQRVRRESEQGWQSGDHVLQGREDLVVADVSEAEVRGTNNRRARGGLRRQLPHRLSSCQQAGRHTRHLAVSLQLARLDTHDSACWLSCLSSIKRRLIKNLICFIILLVYLLLK